MNIVLIYFLFAGTIAVAKCNQYTIENPTIVYYNPKYVKDVVYTVTKAGDAYNVHLEGESLVEFNNNVSVTITFSKKVDDHYEPTTKTWTFKLCQFFLHPMGKLLLQLVPAMKCPFPPQKHSFTFNTVPLEHIPFTNNLDPEWKTGMRVDGLYYVTDSKELLMNHTTEVKIN